VSLIDGDIPFVILVHSLVFIVTYTKCRINTTDSPDDEHRGAENMKRVGINIYEKIIVRQVRYLKDLLLIAF
jgi:hypothetical protein